MKFELNRKEFSEYPDIPEYIVTIKRTEFLKHYEEEPEKLLEELNYLIEMFCSPNCFCKSLSEKALHNIAKNFKTTYREFFLEIVDNEKGQPDLQMGYVRTGA